MADVDCIDFITIRQSSNACNGNWCASVCQKRTTPRHKWCAGILKGEFEEVGLTNSNCFRVTSI